MLQLSNNENYNTQNASKIFILGENYVDWKWTTHDLFKDTRFQFVL